MPVRPVEQAHADHRLSSFSARHPVAVHMTLMASILLFCVGCYAVLTILVRVLFGLLGFGLAWPFCLLIAVVLICVPTTLFLCHEVRHAQSLDVGAVQ